MAPATSNPSEAGKPKGQVRLDAQHARNLRVLQDDIQQFDESWHASPTQVLRIFASLKEHQASIEAGLLAHARQRSSPPLAAMTQTWLMDLAQAIDSGQLSPHDFELADLETMALGLVACISLGQPNLLTNAGVLDVKVKAALDVLHSAVLEGFLQVDEDLQHDHPGAVLNIHNLVSRLCKTVGFQADQTMKRASARFFALMTQWSQAWNQNNRRGLLDLTASVERARDDNPARIIKRAGKAMVQVEMLCEPAHRLLSLASGNKEGDANRLALAHILNWLGSNNAINTYRQAGEQGRVTLSSLAHLYKCLLDWNDLARDTTTGTRLLPLLDAIAELAPALNSPDQLRSLSNFCRLLGTLTKPGQAKLWEGSEPALNSACCSVLAVLLQLNVTGMEVRASTPLFVFLRSMESWLDRRSKPSDEPVKSADPDRVQVTAAAQHLLAALTSAAILAEEKAEHLSALVDVLCWLRGMPALVEQVDTALATLVEHIKACKHSWSANNKSFIAGKLRKLDQLGWKPPTNTQELVQALEQAGGKPQPLKSGTPLSFPIGPDAKEEEEDDEAHAGNTQQAPRGSVVGDRPLAIQPKFESEQAQQAPQASAPRYVPLTRPKANRSNQYTTVQSGPKPQVIVSRPIATVEVEADDSAESSTRKSQEQALSTNARTRTKKKTGPHRMVKLSAEDARAAKEEEMRRFEEDLQNAQAKKTRQVAGKKARMASIEAMEHPPVGQEPQFENRVFPELTEELRQQPFVAPSLPPLEYTGLRFLSSDLQNRVREMEQFSQREPVRRRLLDALKACADQGNASAQYYLGLVHWQGKFVEANHALANDYLTSAWKRRPGQGDLVLGEAAYAAALVMLDGRGGDRADPAFAPTVVTYGVDNGHLPSCHLLGMEFELGRNLKRSPTKAVACWRRGAELGDAQSMYKLGLCHAKGHGVAFDPASAKHWLDLALQNGVEKAEQWIKDLPMLTAPAAVPDTTPQTESESELHAKLTERSITLQEVRSRLDDVEKLPRSESEILKIAQAAAKGDVEAIFQQGELLHHEGKTALAFNHFFRAASLGSANAQFMLGNYRRLGVGTWKSDISAYECYEQAAQSNHPRALLALGYCFETGTGRMEDLAQAKHYYARAREEEAKKVASKEDSNLNPEAADHE